MSGLFDKPNRRYSTPLNINRQRRCRTIRNVGILLLRVGVLVYAEVQQLLGTCTKQKTLAIKCLKGRQAATVAGQGI
jgi:hypothetical protein